MIKKVLKYLARTLTYTLLTLLIIFGLSLLFVFVTSKVAKSRDQEPPINLFTIISPSMTPSINVYDVVVSIRTKPSKIKTGDVISFYSSNPNVNGMTVTHRVTQINQNGAVFSFRTKGDANKSMDSEVIYQDKVVGKVYFKIPQLGRIQFFLGSKGGWLIAILIPALAIISYDIYKIIKLIIVKQKILSYKNGDIEAKTELENNPIVSDVMNDIPKVENQVEVSQDVKPLEVTSQIESPTNPIVDEPITNVVQEIEEPVIVQNSEPVVNLEEQPLVEIKPEQFNELLVSEPEELKIEDLNVMNEDETLEKPESKIEEEQEEIIVISD